jgi:hypothetical protein
MLILDVCMSVNAVRLVKVNGTDVTLFQGALFPVN